MLTQNIIVGSGEGRKRREQRSSFCSVFCALFKDETEEPVREKPVREKPVPINNNQQQSCYAERATNNGTDLRKNRPRFSWVCGGDVVRHKPRGDSINAEESPLTALK